MVDDPVVVGSDAGVAAVFQQRLDLLDHLPVDIDLVRIGDAGRFQISAFDDAEIRVRSQFEQVLDVLVGAVEIRLQHRAGVLQTFRPKSPVDPQRGINPIRLLHVDADEVAQ